MEMTDQITIDDNNCVFVTSKFTYTFPYISVYFDGKYYSVRENKHTSFVIGKEMIVHYNKEEQKSYQYNGLLTISTEKVVNTPYPIMVSQMMLNPHTKRYDFIHELLEYGNEKKVLFEEFIETEVAKKYVDELNKFHEELNKRFWQDVMSKRLSPTDTVVMCKTLQLWIADDK